MNFARQYDRVLVDIAKSLVHWAGMYDAMGHRADAACTRELLETLALAPRYRLPMGGHYLREAHRKGQGPMAWHPSDPRCVLLYPYAAEDSDEAAPSRWTGAVVTAPQSSPRHVRVVPLVQVDGSMAHCWQPPLVEMELREEQEHPIPHVLLPDQFAVLGGDRECLYQEAEEFAREMDVVREFLGVLGCAGVRAYGEPFDGAASLRWREVSEVTPPGSRTLHVRAASRRTRGSPQPFSRGLFTVVDGQASWVNQEDRHLCRSSLREDVCSAEIR